MTDKSPYLSPSAKTAVLRFATRAIHAGQTPDPTTGAVMQPIYATSTFKQSSPGVHTGYEYARTQNPTRMAFERCIADLEGGAHGLRVLLRAGGDAARSSSCWTRAAISSPWTTCTAGAGACSSACASARCGLRVSYADPDRAGLAGEGAAAGHQDDLGRNAVQSAAQGHRSRTRWRRSRKAARDPHRVRQHVRIALAAAAARARLRSGRALDHQIHQRPFRHGRRRRRGRRQHDELAEKLEYMQNAIGSIMDPFSAFSPCAE